MHLEHHVTVYECPERRASGPLLMRAHRPRGAFTAERTVDGVWRAIAKLPAVPGPAWTELVDELACEVLYVGAVAALWPGLDPWPAAEPEPLAT